VSPEDGHYLASQSWNAHKSSRGGWAVTGTHAEKLHRKIMGSAAQGKMIDHRNGNPFDNRRVNLRTCGPIGNAMNQRRRRNKKHSRYKGVTWIAQAVAKPWRAQIQANNEHIHLGCFASEHDAAAAYDAAAARLHGEFARTNASLGLL
jgi:hypothetical protein